MIFSEHFKIKRTEIDDWFDPILFTDTRLFVDPFLIFDNEKAIFVGSHAEIVQFFDYVFQLVAKSQGVRTSRDWERATSLLELHEVRELCIGYSDGGTRGSGSGKGLARQIAGALLTAVRQGVKKLEHFEEVQIFEEGIGADRISDATAGILRHRLAKYTEGIAVRHELPTQEIRYLRSYFDAEKGRWQAAKYKLPLNPYSGDPVLLIPQN
jgi:hypothetical protein